MQGTTTLGGSAREEPSWLSRIANSRAKQSHSGYTIVEVMIFLAISGVMFLVAMSFVDGKQARAEFHNEVNLFDSTLRASVDDIQNGAYPSAATLRCAAGGGATQGSNQACVFLGEALTTAQNSSDYNLNSLSGNRLNGGGAESTSLAEALPYTISSDAHSFGVLQVKQMCLYRTSGGVINNVYGFGVLSSLNTAASQGSNGAVVSAQLYAYPNNAAVGSERVGSISSLRSGIALDKVVIYLDDGTRAAKLTVNDQSGVNTQVSYLDAAGSYGC